MIRIFWGLLALFLLHISFSAVVASSEMGDLYETIKSFLLSTDSVSITCLQITDEEISEILRHLKHDILVEYLGTVQDFLDHEPYLLHAKIIIGTDFAIIGSMNLAPTSLHDDLNDCIVFFEEEALRAISSIFEGFWEGKFEKCVFKTNLGEFYAGPYCDLEQVIMKYLSQAQKSVDIAVYAFTDVNLLGALKYIAYKGVNVRIAVDDWSENHILKYPMDQFEVKVVHGKRLHHKFMIIDGKILITGSANFTESGFHKNREILFVTGDSGIVESYINIFRVIWSRRW